MADAGLTSSTKPVLLAQVVVNTVGNGNSQQGAPTQGLNSAAVEVMSAIAKPTAATAETTPPASASVPLNAAFTGPLVGITVDNR